MDITEARREIRCFNRVDLFCPIDGTCYIMEVKEMDI